jgi:ATP-dependent RNA helicase DHX37/DHR1
VEDLVLQMKALGIDRVANFPFPTPPPAEALQAAEKTLQGLGALSPLGSITAMGHTMSQLPVAPRYARMLTLGHQHGCLPYLISLVSALSVKELFVDSDQSLEEGERGGREERRRLEALRRSWVGKGEFHQLGDLSVLLRAVGAWDYVGGRKDFCQRNGLRHRAMTEVAKLRRQLTNTVNAVCSDIDLAIDPKLAPPTQKQARLLRQIVLSGLGDHVARKIATGHMAAEDKKRLRFSYQVCACVRGCLLTDSV